MPELVDRVFLGCKELVTLVDGPATGSRRRDEMRRLGVVRDGAVAVHGGRVVAVGTTAEVRAAYRGENELDLTGYVVLPGFVDAQTQPVFIPREGGSEQRQNGQGLAAVLRGVREASLPELTAAVVDHLEGFLAHGTTTLEARTGYGLDTEAELKSLRALQLAAEQSPLTVHRTFAGASALPPECEQDPGGHLRRVIAEMLPAVRGKCDSCHVPAEASVFERDLCFELGAAARGVGLGLRVQADAASMGGAEVAVELRAESVHHLARVSRGGRELLARSETTAVLLPAATFGAEVHAPARGLIELGSAVALASAFDASSCAAQSMPLVIALAAANLGMSVEQCITACTINAAVSLGLDAEVGTLHVGKRADLVALGITTYRSLAQLLGGNPVALTVVEGQPVVANVREWEPQT